MIEVPLTRGMVALIDDQDADLILCRKWQAAPAAGSKVYAVGRSQPTDGVTTRQIKMHRLIMRPELGLVVDHLNGNGLDNRRSNMRVVTQSMNLRNTDVARGNKPYQQPGKNGWYISYSDNNRRRKECFKTEAEAWARLAEIHVKLGWLRMAV